MSENLENPHLNKAQQDKERFLESKKGLLPEFEFPQDSEQSPDKEYSKETLMADMLEEKIEPLKEMMDNPELLTNAIEILKSKADSGSQGHLPRATGVFRIYSSLLETEALTPDQITELKPLMHNPELLTNAIKKIKFNIESASQGKEGAAWAFRTYSSLLETKALTPEQIVELKPLIHNPDLITNAIKDLKSHADSGSQGEGLEAAFALWTYSALLKTEALTPEQIVELKPLMNNPELITNAIEDLKSKADSGSQGSKYGADVAFYTYSALLTIQQHLRQEGKSIDEAKSAEQELNPDKSIPPRPEMRSY